MEGQKGEDTAVDSEPQDGEDECEMEPTDFEVRDWKENNMKQLRYHAGTGARSA